MDAAPIKFSHDIAHQIGFVHEQYTGSFRLALVGGRRFNVPSFGLANHGNRWLSFVSFCLGGVAGVSPAEGVASDNVRARGKLSPAKEKIHNLYCNHAFNRRKAP